MADEAFAEELTQRLSVLIGMIMEDEVDAAVSALPAGPVEVSDHIAALRAAGEDIIKLAGAAEVVVRRCSWTAPSEPGERE